MDLPSRAKLAKQDPDPRCHLCFLFWNGMHDGENAAGAPRSHVSIFFSGLRGSRLVWPGGNHVFQLDASQECCMNLDGLGGSTSLA